MSKAAVCDGDWTSTRGRVFAPASSDIYDEGRRLAIDGAQATCGNCQGVFTICATGYDLFDEGRQVVVDNDLVLCPCRKNRVFASPNAGYLFETKEAPSRETSPAGAAKEAPRIFDEQVRASASSTSLQDYPFLIERADGETLFGRVDATGCLPRVTTDGADDYAVYWGDEALARRLGDQP
jgi:hypothetical protein